MSFFVLQNTYDYDRLDRNYRETKGTYGSRTSTLDGMGLTRRFVDRNGRATRYDYNDIHQLTSEVWEGTSGDVRRIEYIEDLAGLVTKVSDVDLQSNSTIVQDFWYNHRGQITRESTQNPLLGQSAQSQNVTIDNEYDKRGLRKKLSTYASFAMTFENVYEYNSLNQMTSVSQSGGGSSPKSATFEYNLAGQLQYLKRYDSSSLVADSVYRYDGAGRLRSITHSEIPIDRTQSWNGTSNSSTVIAAYFLKYDQADRVVGFSSFADAFEATYAYDNRDQLVSASYSPIAGLTSVVPSLPTVENYSFDATGNRTNNGADSASGTHNRLQSDGTYTYQYDNEGNQTSRTEIATGTVTQYTYDHRNRLTKVAAPGKTVLYQYDAQDRRIGKQIDENSNGSIEEGTFWVWDGNQVVLQFKDHDGSGSQLYQLTNRYLYGDIVDLLLADEQVGVADDPYGSSSPYGSSNPISSGSTANRILWPLADHLNSIRDVVDSEQRRREHKVYDTFGRTLSETDFDMYGTELPAGDPAEVDTLFGYTGREWDKDVGLQYNRARWYDPAQGRWLSQDPIGFGGGDANLYRYVENRLTDSIDPSGNSRKSGTYNVKGTDQHLVPVSLWEPFGFAEEAKVLFDKATIPAPNHGRIGHGEKKGYSAHVQKELEDELEKFLKLNGNNGKLNLCQQKEFATHFIEHIRTSQVPFIRGFNENVHDNTLLAAWVKNTGSKIKTPVLRGPGLIKIMGISPTGSMVPKGIKVIGRLVGLVGAYEVYNKARANGMSPENAATLAGLEAVNPIPIGPSEIMDAGYAYQNACEQNMLTNKSRFERLLEASKPSGQIPRTAGGR